MILGEPLGLLALLGAPAVLALHLWRARHAPVAISGLFLWPADRRLLAVGRRRAPLVQRPSLWLELLVVLAATWWLADVHWSPRTLARHVVVVLDDHWRLLAVVDGQSADARVRQLLDQRLASLQEGDRVSLIASGEPPRLLAGPATDPASARSILAGWRPGAASHRLDPALTLAAGLAADGEVVVASDRAPARLPEGVGLIATGRSVSTVGLADVRWWRGAAGPELGTADRLTVVVHGEQPPAPVVEVGATMLTARPEPGHGLFTVDLPLGLPEHVEVVISLNHVDPLSIDDRITLIRPPLRQVRARVAGEGSPSEAARSAVRAAGASLVAGTADLVLGGPGEVGAWSLAWQAGDGSPGLGPFTARHEHPLLLDVDFSGVVWSGGSARATGSPVLLDGDLELISEDRVGSDRHLVLHADLTRRGLITHPAWPSLISNLVAWRLARLPGVPDPNPRCGQPVPVVLPPGVTTCEVVDPSGTVRSLRAGPDGDVILPGLSRPGRWLVRWPGGEAVVNALPVDARQADLAEAETLDLPPAQGAGDVERRRSPLAALLPLLVAALAALAAWASFRREDRG